MAPNLHFSNEKSIFLMKKRYFFNRRSCLGLGVVWWRRGPARSALMQRGARFFQKQCFPCSVALVLGRGGGASCRPATRSGNNQGNTQTNNLTSKKENEENEKHTNIQSNKWSIKQTAKQAHHQSNQTNNKERRRTKPKEGTLY